jgi:holo-[acyl-carrier protein] synthase
MILGIGTDIVDVKRIAKSVENTSFTERVFSAGEIAYCESKVNKAESYAARFAAKEAFFKSLGTGWRGGMAFNEVEVQSDKLGKPFIVLLGNTKMEVAHHLIKHIHLTLSHTKDMSVAFVVLEG